MSGFTVKSPSLQSSLCHLLQVGTYGELHLKYHYIKPMSVTEYHVFYAYEEVCCLDVKLFFFLNEMTLKSQLMLEQFLSICFLIH